MSTVWTVLNPFCTQYTSAAYYGSKILFCCPRGANSHQEHFRSKATECTRSCLPVRCDFSWFWGFYLTVYGFYQGYIGVQ